MRPVLCAAVGVLLLLGGAAGCQRSKPEFTLPQGTYDLPPEPTPAGGGGPKAPPKKETPKGRDGKPDEENKDDRKKSPDPK